MKKVLLLILVALGSQILTGCYHAQISTGLEPSAQVYEQTFASAWIFGLVPPSMVRAQDECRNGVAKVETRLSFVNMLVGNLSFGIYTPMHIKVTCATSARAHVQAISTDLYTIQQADSELQVREILTAAAMESYKSGQPVYVDMR
jgi:hypothetical protein